MRGNITNKIKQISKSLLGVEITQDELRLMPYVQYVLMNSQEIDFRRISEDEVLILADWQKRGWVEIDADHKITTTKPFWDAINEATYYAYVLREEATEHTR